MLKANISLESRNSISKSTLTVTYPGVFHCSSRIQQKQMTYRKPIKYSSGRFLSLESVGRTLSEGPMIISFLFTFLDSAQYYPNRIIKPDIDLRQPGFPWHNLCVSSSSPPQIPILGRIPWSGSCNRIHNFSRCPQNASRCHCPPFQQTERNDSWAWNQCQSWRVLLKIRTICTWEKTC